MPRTLTALTIVPTIAALLASVVVVVACGTLPERLDPTSESQGDAAARPAMSLRWKRVLSDRAQEKKPQEFASAAVGLGAAHDSDTVFIGSHDGRMHSFEAETGRTLWEAKIGSTSSKPVLAQGRLYVGNNDGVMLCLDTSSGEELWRYVTKGPILEAPALTDELIVFSNEDDHVYALDRRSGAFRWQYKTESPDDGTVRGHAGVTISDELAYVGFSSGTLVALRVATGSVAWLTSLASGEEKFMDVDVTPVVVGDTLFAASTAGGLHALDKAVGRVKWRLPVTGVGALVADESRLYAIAADLGAHALDFNGNIIWRRGADGGGEPAAAIISEGYLLYALSDAGLYVADKESGRIVQFFDPGFGISSVPAIARGAMYVFSNSAILYALSLRHYDI